MNKIIGLMMILVIQSCSQNISDNVMLINQIDSIDNSETIYEVLVDSLGIVKDTLSTQRNKVNKSEAIVFSEKIVQRDKGYLKSTNYYRGENNLFYSKSESSELGLLSTTEFWEKDNEIVKGRYIAFRDKKGRDTIIVDYEHFYNENGFKRKSVLVSRYINEEMIGNWTERLYNDQKELTSEIFMESADTLSVTKYNYSKGLLKKKTIENYKNSFLIIFDYDEKGFVLSKTVFKNQMDSLVKNSETRYSANKKGEIIKSVETQFLLNHKKYTEFKYD